MTKRPKASTPALKHPIQPLAKDEGGRYRFKENAIVNALLEHGRKHGLGLNELACMSFSQEDREQFAQLIGYSLDGFNELSYVSDATYAAAAHMAENGFTDPKDARIQALEDQLEQARKGVKEAATALFRIHPDDLHT